MLLPFNRPYYVKKKKKQCWLTELDWGGILPQVCMSALSRVNTFFMSPQEKSHNRCFYAQSKNLKVYYSTLRNLSQSLKTCGVSFPKDSQSRKLVVQYLNMQPWILSQCEHIQYFCEYYLGICHVTDQNYGKCFYSWSYFINNS